MISYNINKKKEIILDDVELSIDIYNNNEMNQLFDYKGGYGLQRITINKYDFTNTTNLYLIRVSNDYVNGNTAYENGNSNYAKELTESIYGN